MPLYRTFSFFRCAFGFHLRNFPANSCALTALFSSLRDFLPSFGQFIIFSLFLSEKRSKRLCGAFLASTSFLTGESRPIFFSYSSSASCLAVSRRKARRKASVSGESKKQQNALSFPSPSAGEVRLKILHSPLCETARRTA